MIRFGVVTYPGSNCDTDVKEALATFEDVEVVGLWHKERALPELDAVVLPGGFTYGDYLRCGAMARFSPIMGAVIPFAEQGGLVLGICNGFQILVEAGLLPGALLRNTGLKFLCQDVHVRIENTETPFTRRIAPGAVLTIPIAHYDGNYYADEATLDGLEAKGGVVFRYTTAEGALDPSGNPNGSERAIAGIVSERGNVLGLMPHPERCCEDIVGGRDGRKIFESMIAHIQERDRR